jgi:hypothetical protein
MVDKAQAEPSGKPPYSPQTMVEVHRLLDDDIAEVDSVFYAPAKGDSAAGCGSGRTGRPPAAVGQRNASAQKQLWLESDRDRSIGRRRHLRSDLQTGAALPMQPYRIGLGEFGQRRAARGHEGEMEAVPRRASEAMTSGRFPVPWRADKIPGGYVVRDANGQALAYIYSRDSEAEALQAKVLTKDEARRIAVNVAKLPGLLRRED